LIFRLTGGVYHPAGAVRLRQDDNSADNSRAVNPNLSPISGKTGKGDIAECPFADGILAICLMNLFATTLGVKNMWGNPITQPPHGIIKKVKLAAEKIGYAQEVKTNRQYILV